MKCNWRQQKERENNLVIVMSGFRQKRTNLHIYCSYTSNVTGLPQSWKNHGISGFFKFSGISGHGILTKIGKSRGKMEF